MVGTGEEGGAHTSQQPCRQPCSHGYLAIQLTGTSFSMENEKQAAQVRFKIKQAAQVRLKIKQAAQVRLKIKQAAQVRLKIKQTG